MNQCDHCQHLVNPYCNGINKKYLNQLGQITDNWYSRNCNLSIYPNFYVGTENNKQILTNDN